MSIEVDIPITPDPSDEDEDEYEDDSDSSHEEYRPNNQNKKKKKLSRKKRPSLRNHSPIHQHKLDQSLQLQLTPLDPTIRTVKIKSSSPTIPSIPTTTTSMTTKTCNAKRRISIQNEAELIRNKNSPTENSPKKHRTIKLKEKFILSASSTTTSTTTSTPSNVEIDQPTPPSTRSSSRRNSRRSSPIEDNPTITTVQIEEKPTNTKKFEFEVPVKPSRKRRRQSNPELLQAEDVQQSTPAAPVGRPRKQNSVAKRKAEVLDPVPELAAMSPIKKRRYNAHKILPPSPSTEKWQKSLRVNPERMLKQIHIKDAALAAAAAATSSDDEDVLAAQ